MCFARGPSAEEQALAQEQREAAQQAKEIAVSERAETKREDISEAVTSRNIQQGRRGGMGRRSLLTSPSGGAGYASRF
jgi:hypothetical protein